MDRSHVRWALAAGFLGAVVYVNALHNPFTFDDTSEVIENPSIRDIRHLETIARYSVTRPVVNLSYAVDYAIWALNPFGYHLTNLFLHVVAVLLLFALVHGVRGPRAPAQTMAPVAFAAAAIFAVHPMMTGAVGYVSARSELLSGVLVLASLLLFRRGLPTLDGRWIAGGLALFILALGTKETAAMLPFLLLAYDLLLAEREALRRRLWRLHLPLISLVLLAGAGRAWLYIAVEHPDSAGPQWGNLLVNLHVAARYLGLLLVPASQSVVHTVYPITSVLDGRVAAAVAALAIVGWAAIAARERNPLITFGLVWFALLSAPSAALILLADRGQPMAEHRIYAASLGFFAAAAAGLAEIEGPGSGRRGRLIATTACVGLLIAIFGVLTIARNRVWSDPVALWEDAARKAPNTYASHFGLGDAYRSTGDCASAIPAFRRAITLVPLNEEAYLRLADCTREVAGDEQARLVLRAAVARAVETSRARVALAALEADRGNYSEALRLCQEVAAERPGDRDAAACISLNQPR